MKEVIEEILEEEKKGRERIEQAKEKAKRIRIKAEEDSQHMVTTAREKAQEEAKMLMVRVEEEANKQRERELQKAAQNGESLWDKKKKKIEETVEALFRMVLGEEVR